MGRAYYTDIRRSVKKGWRRFLSILIITALGVGMMTGLHAACLDMYYSADRFFKQQNLFDIRILSTLGLTQADVDALARVDRVAAAEGGYSKTAYTDVGGVRREAEVTVLNPGGLNAPYLLTGAMPERAGEIAVTPAYLEESGKTLGDTLTMEEDAAGDESVPRESAADDWGAALDPDTAETPAFPRSVYTITGTVLSPMAIQSGGGGGAFRSTAADADYTFFITGADAEIDVFTVVYITLSGTEGMRAYSDEYEGAVQSVIRHIEGEVKARREQARHDAVLQEAREKISEAEDAARQEFAEADKKLADARQELTRAEEDLAQGRASLTREEQDAEAELRAARWDIEDAKNSFSQWEAQLLLGEGELTAGAEELAAGEASLSAERQAALQQLFAAEEQLLTAQAELDTARAEIEAGIAPLQAALGGAWPEAEWNALVSAAASLAAAGAGEDAIAHETAAQRAALSAALFGQGEAGVRAALALGKVQGGQQTLDAQKSALEAQRAAALQALSEAESALEQGAAELAAGRRAMAERWTELENAKAELARGEARLNAEEAEARAKIADGWGELSDGERELAEGKAELTKQEQAYTEKKAEVEEKLADAYAGLSDIDRTQWYVQDRASLESYSSLDSDLSSIQAIGRIFPLLFLLVAALVSLTTMTRMVEEERGIIGVYKALGFEGAAVYRKYLLFAFSACLLGGLLGDMLGFILMPRFIAVVLEELYVLPQHFLRFDALYGVGGVLLFMLVVVGATALACRSELRQTPAALLRPKAPRAGTRVLLERVPGIWNRLTFLNKVTVRNLFRYKRRLFMTVGGIMGCTALVLLGFAIKDSVADLAPGQYGRIDRYDLMAVFEDGESGALLRQLAEDDGVEKSLPLRIESVKLTGAGEKSEQVQLLVIPDDGEIGDYIRLTGTNGRRAQPDESGIWITRNAARILGLRIGDTASLQNMALDRREAAVSGIVENYLGNRVYMTRAVYASLFGPYAPNGALARLSGAVTDHAAYAEALEARDSVLSAVSTAALRDEFGFDLMNAVVLLLIVMAGGLAFVVLFTLSSTNISERVRELATIKVLGFYDGEVYQYVHKETLILTFGGILLGLPLGRLLAGLLMTTLNMPAIHFAVHIEPVSYLISGAITLCFALAVNLLTNRALRRINMVEALKSVE